MAGFLLDAATTILCPHGGQVTVVPRVTRVALAGRPPLLSGDVATVAGCPFNVSGSPSPCLTVEWLLPAAATMIEDGEPLLSTSIGVCKNAAEAPQGSATLSGYQTRVQGR